MEEYENVLWAIPCDDHVIYLDMDGYLNERYGMAYIKGERGSEFRFIDGNGMLDDPYGDLPVESIIGRRGETIPISRLNKVFAFNAGNIDLVFSYLADFDVKVDVASMKQTLEVHFIRQEGFEPIYNMNIKMKDSDEVFANLRKNFFDMRNPDCVRAKPQRGKYPARINDVLVQYLYEYSCYRDTLVDVEIYFDKRTFFGESDLGKIMAMDYNKFVYDDEEKYLMNLRRRVKDTLGKWWNDYKSRDAQIKASQDAKLEVASRFDLDPNLME